MIKKYLQSGITPITFLLTVVVIIATLFATFSVSVIIISKTTPLPDGPEPTPGKILNPPQISPTIIQIPTPTVPKPIPTRIPIRRVPTPTPAPTIIVPTPTPDIFSNLVPTDTPVPTPTPTIVFDTPTPTDHIK